MNLIKYAPVAGWRRERGLLYIYRAVIFCSTPCYLFCYLFDSAWHSVVLYHMFWMCMWRVNKWKGYTAAAVVRVVLLIVSPRSLGCEVCRVQNSVPGVSEVEKGEHRRSYIRMYERCEGHYLIVCCTAAATEPGRDPFAPWCTGGPPACPAAESSRKDPWMAGREKFGKFRKQSS